MAAKKNENLAQGFVDFVNNTEEICIDSKNILEIMPSLLKLQNEKGNIYGRSWCKHGEFSAFFNLERKWDRIQNIMERAMEEGVEKTLHSDASSTPTETFTDTVVDLGIYSLMWVGFIKENYPEEWERFLKLNNLK